MPQRLHRALEREADKKGLTGKRRDVYVYGTLARYKERQEKKKEKAK